MLFKIVKTRWVVMNMVFFLIGNCVIFSLFQGTTLTSEPEVEYVSSNFSESEILKTREEPDKINSTDKLNRTEHKLNSTEIQSNSTTGSRTVEKVVPIFNQSDPWNRRTVQKVQYCLPGQDKARVGRLYSLFKFWDSFANEIGLEYFMMYGSLLGVHRFEGILPYDHDVDVMIKSSDTAKLEMWANRSYEFIDARDGKPNVCHLRLHPDWKLPISSRHLSNWTNFKECNARVFPMRGYYFLDVWGLPPHPNKTDHGQILDKYQDWKPMDVNMSWIYPLKPCNFQKHYVKCPNKVEKVLELLYNDYWRWGMVCYGQWILDRGRNKGARDW